jgi:hypothetical protein
VQPEAKFQWSELVRIARVRGFVCSDQRLGGIHCTASPRCRFTMRSRSVASRDRSTARQRLRIRRLHVVQYGYRLTSK